MFLFLFLFFSILFYAHFSDKRIISSEKYFNYVFTSLLLRFLKMPKIWVGRTTLNGEKKEDGLKPSSGIPSNIQHV